MQIKRLLLGVLMMVWAVSAQAASLDDTLAAFSVQVPRIHKLAPEFSLPRLGGGLGGRRDGLQKYRGKVVLLQFWATWCLACRHEMPQIESLWQHYQSQGFVVLGVNVDRGNVSGVRDFVHERGLSFPTVLDSAGDVRNRYEIRAFPTSYLIGRDGLIIGRVIGERDWSSKAAHAMLDAVLSERIPNERK